MPARNSPRISSVKPEKWEQLRARYVEVLGERFKGPSFAPPALRAFIGTVSCTVVFVNDTHVRVEVPATIHAGEYDLYIVNAGDGHNSNRFPVKIFDGKSARPNAIRQIVDQRVQPLAIPFEMRNDSQRIRAGNQFDELLPDVDQGLWKDGAAPLHGGRWTWADDIVISQITLLSDGAEPGPGRGITSGVYLMRRDGSKVKMLDFNGPFATTESIRNSDTLEVKKGEEIRVLTTGATKEMEVTLTIRALRPFISPL